MNKKILLKRMIRNPFFVVGFFVVLLLVLAVFLSPLYVQYDPNKNSLREKFMAPEGFSRGLSGHVLGTDEMGRDVFTRLLLGGRYSLIIAFIVILIQVLVGTLLGITAGYMGGWADAAIMRFCDVVLAIPNLILAIAVMSVMGTSLFNLVAVLAFSGWVRACRVTRNNVKVIKNQEFVHASQVLGAGTGHIMLTQILPNVTTYILILASQNFGQTILWEASLSFLNLGIQPPTPSWGNMISAGRSYMAIYPWLVTAPGIALMIAVLAFNFLGDGLRDVLDPRRKA